MFLFHIASYFKLPKTIRLNATHYFIMKIPNKRKLQQIASDHLSDIDSKYSMKVSEDYTKEPCSFLVYGAAYSSDNSLQFKKDLLTKSRKTKLNII